MEKLSNGPADRIHQFAHSLLLSDATRAQLIDMWNPADLQARQTAAAGYVAKIGLYSDSLANLDELKKAQDETKDELTDSLTRRAFNNLLGEAMETHGAELENQGWTAQICLIDLNKLGQHNDLGGFSAGDQATQSIMGAIKRTFRRNPGQIEIDNEEVGSEDELPNKQEHLELISSAIESKTTHDIIARLGGDEFVIVTFIPPGENNRRGSEAEQVEILNKEKNRVQQSLSNINISYPVIRNDISDKKRDYTKGKQLNIIDRPVIGSHANVTVSCTFSVSRIDRFDSESIIETIATLGEVIEFRKEKRADLATAGDAIQIAA